MYCYFPVIELVNFVKVGPGYSSQTITYSVGPVYKEGEPSHPHISSFFAWCVYEVGRVTLALE